MSDEYRSPQGEKPASLDGQGFIAQDLHAAASGIIQVLQGNLEELGSSVGADDQALVDELAQLVTQIGKQIGEPPISSV